MTFAKSQIP